MGGGDVCTASRLTLDDGTSLFTKTWPSGDAAGAASSPPRRPGWRWLREAGAVPIPEVLVALPEMLAMEWIDAGPPPPGGRRALRPRPGRAAPRRRGRASAPPWPGFIGPLPLDNTPSAGPVGRLVRRAPAAPVPARSRPTAARCPRADVAAVEQIINTIDAVRRRASRPPASTATCGRATCCGRADGRAWLVDPAAHGGHRETDLAQLALFGGAPHLDDDPGRVPEVWPLADGWRDAGAAAPAAPAAGAHGGLRRRLPGGGAGRPRPVADHARTLGTDPPPGPPGRLAPRPAWPPIRPAAAPRWAPTRLPIRPAAAPSRPVPGPRSRLSPLGRRCAQPARPRPPVRPGDSPLGPRSARATRPRSARRLASPEGPALAGRELRFGSALNSAARRSARSPDLSEKRQALTDLVRARVRSSP